MVSSGRSGKKGRPYTAVLNAFSSCNETLVSVALESKSNEDIAGPLRNLRERIDKLGGQVSNLAVKFLGIELVVFEV